MQTQAQADRQDTLREDSGSIKARIEQEMQRFLGRSSLSLRQKVAVGCRILANEGHAATLAGQITVRVDDTSFWTTNFASGLREATAGNLLRVDRDMKVIEGEGMPNPAVRFHLWIYERRPDVRAIVHTHAPYASALSMLDQPLLAGQMDGMMFHDGCAHLREWPGVPLANEEGELISGALGQKSAILLAHHGLLTVGDSVEAAVYLAVSFENAARLQMLAQSAGTIRLPPAGPAADARRFLTGSSFVNATFNYWARQAIRQDAAVLS
jgi:L-fuculose-phosphate aldolase